MNDLVKLLAEYTSPQGTWSLDWNDHRTNYISAEEELVEHMRFCDDELVGVDFTKDIFVLHWYKDTPVGSYKLVANSVEGIIKKVNEIIKASKL